MRRLIYKIISGFSFGFQRFFSSFNLKLIVHDLRWKNMHFFFRTQAEELQLRMNAVYNVNHRSGSPGLYYNLLIIAATLLSLEDLTLRVKYNLIIPHY